MTPRRRHAHGWTLEPYPGRDTARCTWCAQLGVDAPATHRVTAPYRRYTDGVSGATHGRATVRVACEWHCRMALREAP